MQTSQMRLDLPLEEQPNLINHLNKYSSVYIIGHEISKTSKKSHFHIHFEHEKHIDTIRRHFRKTYPDLKQMGFYLKKIKTTNIKSMAYVIKDSNYTKKNIPSEQIDEATKLVLAFEEEGNIKTLRDKILFRLNQKEHSKKWTFNTEVMTEILLIFKHKELTYPSQSWMKQCIVSFWMQDPTRTLAMANIEKIYNIQDPFIQGSEPLIFQ